MRAHLAGLILLGTAAGSIAFGCSCTVTRATHLLGSPPTNEEIREQAINANTAKVRINVALDQREYSPRQQAQVTISIENPTDESLEIWDFTPDFFYLKGTFPCSLQCGWNRTQTRRIDAGAPITQTFPLKWETGTFGSAVPKKPGDYTLLYTYPSEPVGFRVVPEEPVLVRAALQRGISDYLLQIYGKGLEYGCAAPFQVLIGGMTIEVKSSHAAEHYTLKDVLDEVGVVVPFETRPQGAHLKLLCSGRETNEITVGATP